MLHVERELNRCVVMKRLREEGRHRVVDVPVLPVQKRLVRALANRRRCQILEDRKQQNRSGGGESFRFPSPDPEKVRGGGVQDKQPPIISQVAATSEIRDTEEGGKSTTGEGPPFKVMVAISLSGIFFLL